MPSFESCILAPPPGFVAGCRALNSKSKTQLGFGEAVHSGINIVKTNCISSLDYTRREAQPLNALGVVTYLTMSWFLSTPKPSEKDVATFLDLNSALSRDVIEAFVTTYNDVNQAHQLASAPSSVKLGKIQKLSWKVGVTISSSKCAGVNSITMIECFVLIILSICNLKYLHQILMRLTCKYHYYYEKREIIYHVIK